MHRCPTDIWTVETEVQKRGESHGLILGRILEVIIEAMNIYRASKGEQIKWHGKMPSVM